jgi:GNAT superfamily N-acetyltransferase
MFVARAGQSSDYGVYARLFPELGVDDPLLSPEQFAERMLPRVLVLEGASEEAAGASAAGYASWQVYGETAHVVHVVVDPRARRQGAGHTLMEAVRARALADGCTRWMLNVKAENAPAIRLYERCGLAIERQGWAVLTAWSQLRALPEARTHAVPFVPSCDEDGSLAVRLDLPTERIALLRRRTGVVLLGLREDSEPVAFAAFDPAFPGIYPLRVARVDLARPMFDLLGSHASSGEDRVFVVVEGDRALLDALMAVGASVRHAFLRMGGVVRH